MKILNAFVSSMKKNDTIPLEKLENSRVMSTIIGYCEQYLKDSDDIFKFEALPEALDSTIAVLDSKQFLDKYEFSQISDTVFIVRMRDLGIL